MTGREKKMNKRGMNEEGDVSRKGGLEGEMQESRENGYREKERERLMKTEDRSLFCQPLSPVD